MIPSDLHEFFDDSPGGYGADGQPAAICEQNKRGSGYKRGSSEGGTKKEEV